ncbi:MAG TPA: hypothetical protein VJ720_01515 [Chitinophaga sp.]|nr:hypothetical protein [Chitinophaga sp.]
MKTEAVMRKMSLKGLQTHLNERSSERQVLLFKLNGLNDQLRQCNKEINQTEKMIRLLKDRDLIVSEHAIVRYLERVETVNPSEVPRKILTDKLREMVATLGNGTYPVNDFLVVVKNNVVITVKKQ